MKDSRVLITLMLGVAIVGALYASSLYSYLFFHMLSEMIAVIVAFTIFIMAVYSQKFGQNGFLLCLGSMFASIGTIVLLHSMAYKGMNIFTGFDSNLPTQLWIASRYVLGLTLLVAPVFLTRRVKPLAVYAIYTIVTTLLLLSIFVWKIFPACYVEGAGLTPFKIYSEYVISTILLLSIYHLSRYRKHIDSGVFKSIAMAMVASVFAELFFTSYIGVYDFANMVGHMFQTGSFALFANAIIYTGFARPHDLLYRNLKQSEQALKLTQDRMDLAFETSSIAVFTAGPDLRYTWVYNTRIKPDLLLGKRDDEVIDPEEARPIMEFKQAVIEKGEGMRKEFPVILNGERHLLDMNVKPLFDEQGAVSGISAVVVDMTRLRQMEQEVQRNTHAIEMYKHLMRGREMERLRIAQDIHDGPIQELLSIKFAMYALQQKATSPEVREMVEQTSELVSEQIDELRQVCNELRPPALIHFGLSKAIHSHTDRFNSRYPRLKIELELQEIGADIPEETRLAVFRIYQEVLNNIGKHAGADRVDVRLAMDEENIYLDVRDNGRGFDLPENWLDLPRHGHFGLIGLRERAEAAGGSLEFHSSPGNGTHVAVQLPVEQRMLDVALN